MLVMFFFFKQKTAYEMRISDWSSDVCSSDLLKTLREMTRAMLLDRGFGRVETCDDGAPALAFLDALAPAGGDARCDLILLALNMPGLDGPEVLRHLADRQFTDPVAPLRAQSHRPAEPPAGEAGDRQGTTRWP